MENYSLSNEVVLKETKEKGSPFLATVCILHNEEKNEVLLVKRARDPYKGSWSFVGGIGAFKDNSSDPSIAIKFEVYCDLNIKLEEVCFFTYQYSSNLDSNATITNSDSNSNTSSVSLIFTAAIPKESDLDCYKITPNPLYVSEYKWFSFEEIDSQQISLAFNGSQYLKLFNEHNLFNSIYKLRTQRYFPPKAYFFDLDGTLVDNSKCVADCYQHTCQTMGYQVTTQIILQLKGLSALDTAKSLGIPDQKLSEFVELYFKNIEEFAMQGVIFDKVKELLKLIKSQIPTSKENQLESTILPSTATIPICIITSNKTALAKRILEKVGILEYIDHVIGADMCSMPKPDPEQIFLACKKINIKPNKSIFYVGDSFADMKAAQSARLTSCLVNGENKFQNDSYFNQINQLYHALVHFYSIK